MADTSDSPDLHEFTVCAPVPVTLDTGRPVITGERVEVDPAKNEALIDAGWLVPTKRSHAARKRSTTPKE